MEKLNLTTDELKKLEPLHLIEGTIEKESTMYYAPNNEKEVIKVYNNFNDKLYLMTRLKTIRNLLKYTKEIDFPELLKPLGFALIDNKIIGTIYPEIDAYTARIYLYSNIIPLKVKIEILKKIGLLLEKIKNTNPKYNAAFSDVHIDNFLVDNIIVDDKKNIRDLSIIACDTDSMKIMDSKGNPAYYLYDSERLSRFEKYRLDKDKNIIPDSNTDIYCYIMLILDFISQSHFIYCLNPKEYNHYLDYLDKININHNLLNAFASIYENDIDNISPIPYLNSLNEINEKASLQSFYKSR